jgi:uncharacterized protein YbaP (TraB family)
MKLKLLAALLALLPGLACAQAANPPAPPANQTAPAPRPAPPPLPGADRDADPALWVVRDADTTIYLFGTIHLLDGRTWFNDEVKTAFDTSGELVLEARLPEDPASLQGMIIRYALDPQGPTLSSRLTPAQNATLNRALGTIGVPQGAFEHLEPWFVSLTLSAVLVQQLGLNAESGPETILTHAAQARHIPIGELEGMEFQIRLFDAMPAALQLAQLTGTLDELDHVREKFLPLLAAWSAGNAEQLGRVTAEEEGDKAEDRALHRIVFTDRNTAWASWIQRRLAQPGTVFIAVGAAHLAGDDSVQVHLRGLGIQSARVPHRIVR